MRLGAIFLSGCLVAFLSTFSHSAEGDNTLTAELKVFEPLIGKTFRGEFANSTPEKPIVDISRWERAMNGKAVRNLHSVNRGEYGGETIIMWDAKQKKIAFWYFTSAGFYTSGTFDINGNTWTSLEKVTGNENGITEVKATSQLSEDGKLSVKSQYLKDGQWVPGNERLYTVANDEQVVFK